MIRDLAGACALLTRLPVGRLAEGAEPARGLWAYPVIGALIGALGAGCYALGRALGLGAPLAAIWTLAVLLVATGALHEDGLADAADALGGGGTAERRLAILRDSRIGTFGALALMLAVGTRVAALATLTPDAAFAALVAAGALGRAAMLLPVLLLRPARAEGLGASLGGRSDVTVWQGLGLGALLAFAALPVRPAAGAILLAALAGLSVAALARRRLGGYTGDVLGAGSVIAECLVLTLLSSLFH
jgi:adenosylcobinamide-GDP ribazoletransferase